MDGRLLMGNPYAIHAACQQRGSRVVNAEETGFLLDFFLYLLYLLRTFLTFLLQLRLGFITHIFFRCIVDLFHTLEAQLLRVPIQVAAIPTTALERSCHEK